MQCPHCRNTFEVVGSKEAADLLKVSVPSFQNWKKREDFPQPLTVVGQGALWLREDIENYVNVRQEANMEKLADQFRKSLERLNEEDREKLLARLVPQS